MKVNQIKLSDQVRDAIKNCGQSCYAICKLTGLDKSALSRFMSGERGMSTTSLDIIAEHLELNIVSSRKPAKRK